MGRIAAKNKQPSCKFVFPPNLDASLTENQPFTMKMAINKLAAGFFTNATVKYFSAPQVRCFLVHNSLMVVSRIDRRQKRDH